MRVGQSHPVSNVTVANNIINNSLFVGLDMDFCGAGVVVENNAINSPGTTGVSIPSGATGSAQVLYNSVQNVASGQSAYVDNAGGSFTATLTGNSWQSFTKKLVPGTTISLKAMANGDYVTAANSTTALIANSTTVGQTQEYNVVDAGGGNIALQALANNDYVCADSGGASPLIANRTSFGQWETYTELDAGSGNTGLRALANNEIVTADNAGANPLIANRNAVGSWETFTVGVVIGGGGVVGPTNGSTYHLICQDSGKALDNGGSTTVGTVVNQWADTANNSNQEWKLVATSGGYYNLVCQTSGMVLDNGGSTTNGSSVKQWTVANNANQNWTFVNVGGTYPWHLKCQTGGLSLDNRGSTTDGTAVGQWTDGGSGNPNQNWQLQFIR